MNIYVFTQKGVSVKDVFSRDAQLKKQTQFLSLADIQKHSPEDDSISYIDVSGLDDAQLKKIILQIKKVCKNSPWGVIDLKGSIKDIASLFFEGACDYLGHAFLKNLNVDAKRYKTLFARRKPAFYSDSGNNDEYKKSGKSEDSFLKNGIKMPPSSVFPGWNKMQSGKTIPFYLLYCSLKGKTALDLRLDEKSLSQLHRKFISYLNNNLTGAGGLLWMDTGSDCLFLIPPKIKSAEAAAESCLRMIISAPLAASETLGVSFPVNFVFALHYGSVSYKPPGKTGTVVSDAVNSVFHLGTKKAEPGRLTVSNDLPEASIQKSIKDLFTSCGEYEDRKIWHTKKFSYNKAWV